jgi:hypothetical protein
LKPKNDAAKNLKTTFQKGDIKKFLEQIQEIENKFLDIFIYDPENGKLKFKKDRKIKYGWLRNYTKESFYDWRKEKNKNAKEYELTEINYLNDIFVNWLNDWQDLGERLENFTNTEEHKQERRSEIAFILRGFLKRR